MTFVLVLLFKYGVRYRTKLKSTSWYGETYLSIILVPLSVLLFVVRTLLMRCCSVCALYMPTWDLLASPSSSFSWESLHSSSLRRHRCGWTPSPSCSSSTILRYNIRSFYVLATDLECYVCSMRYLVQNAMLQQKLWVIYSAQVVGVGSVFFWPAPVLLKQGYLVITAVVTAYMFTYIPEWTTWTLLVAMAIYDLYAVLTPGGPLKVSFLLTRLPVYLVFPA